MPVATGHSPFSAAARPRIGRWAVVVVLAVSLHGWLAISLTRRAPPSPTERIPIQIALLRAQPVNLANSRPGNAAGQAGPAGATAGNAPGGATALRIDTASTVAPAVPEKNITQPAQPSKRAAPQRANRDAAKRAAVAPPRPGSAASPSGKLPAVSNAVPAQAEAVNTDTAKLQNSAAAVDKPAPQAGGAAPVGERFVLPPSADLRYATFFNGAQNQTGTIHWFTDTRRYELLVSVPLPFIGTYSYHSTGHIDGWGLAPDRYVETRGRRGESVTTFDRMSGAAQIHFGRNAAPVAFAPGAQDRFSMVMQLSSLVGGDPARYQPGVTREFFVADDENGEIWPITTVGPDSVQTRAGMLQAIHFMRLPRRMGDRRRIDIWLAPSLKWLPVRILQTEPNGTEFELLYDGRAKAQARDSAAAPQDRPSDTAGAPGSSTLPLGQGATPTPRTGMNSAQQ